MKISIIGAGPGGLITGLKLIEAGFTPEIIEKREVLESTLCGEGLSADTLKRVPFQDWSHYAPEAFEKATFIFPGGCRAYAEKKCYTMDRTSWFRAMAKEFEKQGGTLSLGEKVLSVHDLKADVIIGADGPFSVAAKFVGNTTQNIGGVQYRMKADYHYDGMEFIINKKYSDEYSWIFAKGGTLNVGLLGRQQQLEEFIDDFGLRGGEILKKEAYNIPFFGTKVQRGNVILTGDAAGMTNPLTKGGMAAIVHAADIIVDCLKEGKIAEFNERIFSHPIMSPVYKEALRYFRELDNEKLEKLGKMMDGKILNKLDKKTKLKFILASIISPAKMRTLMKANSYANRYSW